MKTFFFCIFYHSIFISNFFQTKIIFFDDIVFCLLKFNIIFFLFLLNFYGKKKSFFLKNVQEMRRKCIKIFGVISNVLQNYNEF